MSEQIHILLIDDEKSESAFISAFKRSARRFAMKIEHYDRGKTGLKELRLNPYKYKGIILDARCIWDVNHHYPEDDFLVTAILELERLEKKLNLTFPLVVNTGFVDKFDKNRARVRERNGNIFAKNSSNSDEIFTFLENKIKNPELWTYRDVFEIFDKGYLARNIQTDLLNILKKLNDPTDIKNNFNPIRKVLEEVYIKLNQTDTNFIPNRFFGRGVDVGGISHYLKRYFSSKIHNHQFSCVDAIKFLTNTISHRYSPNVSIYTYKTAVFALLETLLWFKEKMNEWNT